MRTRLISSQLTPALSRPTCTSLGAWVEGRRSRPGSVTSFGLTIRDPGQSGPYAVFRSLNHRRQRECHADSAHNVGTRSHQRRSIGATRPHAGRARPIGQLRVRRGRSRSGFDNASRALVSAHGVTGLTDGDSRASFYATRNLRGGDPWHPRCTNPRAS